MLESPALRGSVVLKLHGVAREKDLPMRVWCSEENAFEGVVVVVIVEAGQAVDAAIEDVGRAAA